ncbi:MAG: NAD(P)H-dependent glycerol-3-phosphate dehydrogenase [Candidatus Eisenbacteria bacterium]|nr:NAD(P)H-dependent glycerol-3-phosphate dehydrogenase [Candidatus Eisenbacteria bacterium]
MTVATRPPIAVLGGGSWGTALALHLERGGHSPRLWIRDPEQAQQIAASRKNTKYLPQWTLPQSIQVTAKLDEALHEAGVVVIAVPSASLAELGQWLRRGRPRADVLWVLATKGLQGEGLRASQILLRELGDEPQSWAVLAGPSLAAEVLEQLPTAVLAASLRPEPARTVQELFHAERFRVYTSGDVVGVELGVSLKNVIAIAAGLAQELSLGHNGYGALLTRGLAEMSRLGLAFGAQRETFLGLAGLGDLVTTCGSPLSRNHRVGRRLARGEPLESILRVMGQVAEGVPTTRAALRLAERMAVDMPITREMFAILFEEKDPRRALQDLMLRRPRDETDDGFAHPRDRGADNEAGAGR